MLSRKLLALVNEDLRATLEMDGVLNSMLSDRGVSVEVHLLNEIFTESELSMMYEADHNGKAGVVAITDEAKLQALTRILVRMYEITRRENAGHLVSSHYYTENVGILSAAVATVHDGIIEFYGLSMKSIVVLKGRLSREIFTNEPLLTTTLGLNRVAFSVTSTLSDERTTLRISNNTAPVHEGEKLSFFKTLTREGEPNLIISSQDSEGTCKQFTAWNKLVKPAIAGDYLEIYGTSDLRTLPSLAFMDITVSEHRLTYKRKYREVDALTLAKHLNEEKHEQPSIF